MTLNTPPIDWFGLSPVLTLTGTAFGALLCAVLVPRAARRLAAAGIAVAGFTAGLVLAPWGVLPWALVLLACTAWITVGQRVLHVRKQLLMGGTDQ